MSKNRFKSTKIQAVALEKMLVAATGLRLVVGVDVAKREQFAAIREYRADEQESLVLVSWMHPEETTRFVELLGALQGVASLVEVVMEPTGTYGDPIRYELVGAGLPVFRVSTKRSHDAAEVFDGVNSMHDRKAAWVLTRLHENGATQLWETASEEQRELRASYEHWRLCESDGQRYMGKLEGMLARHWPGLAELLPLTRATLAHLLMDFGGPTGVAAAPAAARAMMQRVGGQFLKEEVIEAVLESASTQAAKMSQQATQMVPAEKALLKRLARGVQEARTEGAKARQVLEKLVPPACAELQQMVGPALTVALLGSGAEPRQVESPSAFVKALGLNLKVFSSGERKTGGLHITKRGDGDLRQLLYLAALRILQTEPIVRAWYERKVERDGGKAKIKAVVAVMRKLARAIWHVARGQAFDASKLFDTRRLELQRPPGLMGRNRVRPAEPPSPHKESAAECGGAT